MHARAKLTPFGRLLLVQRVTVNGWSAARTAEAMGVSRATAYKWLGRFGAEGTAGLADRSSRPRECRHALPTEEIQRIVRARRRLKQGPHRLAWALGRSRSTIYAVLRRHHLSRLRDNDRATTEPPDIERALTEWLERPKMTPAEVVAILNEAFDSLCIVIKDFGGDIDKFIGDAIMAVWGNVRSLGMTQDAKNCAHAALGMRRELRKLNEKWRGEGRMGLGMAIGINQGEVIVGNVGSQERMDPTVIGDAVNLASRLESLTRVYGIDILVGASAAELVRDEVYLRSVARVQVKGKTKPVDVFTFVGGRGDKVDPELLKWLETYEEGLEKFRSREFTKGKILFSRFLEFYPDDYLAKMYLDRTLEYEQAPPDEAWEAVEVFQKK